jgi:hypothetical protein
MMKRSLLVLSILFCLAVSIANAQCTQTGFFRDGINLTASMINPTSPVSGQIIATTCNIGIYIDNGDVTIENSEISGANYYGIVVNGDVNHVSASITNNYIHDIGESPLSGMQHGIAVYVRAMNLTSSASGTVATNDIRRYQKGGIVVSGQGANVGITDNVLTGEGAVPYIAQNGIQVGYGAMASVMRNKVYGHSYSGANNASSAGILVVGGEYFGLGLPYVVNARIMQNTLLGNDVGVFIYQADSNYNVPSTPTNIKVVNNTISSSWTINANNQTGNGGTPYMAGVSDYGNADKIINNSISGYPACSGLCSPIDTTGSAKIKAHANTTD